MKCIIIHVNPLVAEMRITTTKMIKKEISKEFFSHLPLTASVHLRYSSELKTQRSKNVWRKSDNNRQMSCDWNQTELEEPLNLLFRLIISLSFVLVFKNLLTFNNYLQMRLWCF